AKMIPAVILWMGPMAAFPFVFWMALTGGLFTLVILMVRRSMPAAIIPGFIRAPFEPEAGVPYGVAIAAGAFLAGPGSPMLASLFEAAGFVS
ncbi:MAG: pilus assembly protein CpaA, partial [Hyphomonas sp.]